MEKREVVIVEVMRTAFGKMGGSLKDFTAEELGAIALKGLVEKTGITEKAHVDSVFAGSAFPMAYAINPARWAVLNAGLPLSTSASFVEMQCGSAIDSINHAAWKILVQPGRHRDRRRHGVVQSTAGEVLDQPGAVQTEAAEAS